MTDVEKKIIAAGLFTEEEVKFINEKVNDLIYLNKKKEKVLALMQKATKAIDMCDDRQNRILAQIQDMKNGDMLCGIITRLLNEGGDPQ